MSLPLSTEEAPEVLGLSPRQVTRLAQQARITGASKPGRDWVFEPPRGPAARAAAGMAATAG